MAVDKLVDSTQLDADLTSVANAIRVKSGGSGQLAFPAGFVSEIGNISVGETYYVVPRSGCIYPKKLNQTLVGFNATQQGTNRWRYCEYMEEAYVAGLSGVAGGQNSEIFSNCTNLKKATLPNFTSSGTYVFRGDTALEEVQLGSIGNAVTGLSAYTFNSCNQSGLTITIYVTDETSIPLSVSPWGATNATVIYRSSATGEVRTV